MGYSDEILSDSPALYWTMRDTSALLKSAPAGSDITPGAGCTPGTGALTPVTNHPSFRLVNGQFGVPPAYPAVLTAAMTALSIEWWVRPTATTNSNSSGNGLFWSNGRGEAYLPNGSLTPRTDFTMANGTTYTVNATAALTLNAWNHLVLIADNASIRWYVNRVAAGSGGPSGQSLPAATGPFIIAGFNLANADWADVALYAYSLSATQITNHYKSRFRGAVIL